MTREALTTAAAAAAAAAAVGFDLDLSWLEVVAPVAGNFIGQGWEKPSSNVVTPVTARASTVQLAKGPYKYRFSDTDTDLNIIIWEPSVSTDGNGLVVKCFGGTFKP
jgi:hypothetical protein